MGDPFARMHDRLLARLGSEAVLHGQSVTVALEHGVAITGEMGAVVAYRSVATIPRAGAAKVGDTITIGGTDYVIDALLDANGYVDRCILR